MDDYSYVNYLTTFFVWIFSIYPAMAMLRLEYGQVTFTRVAYYLAGVSAFQCISALLIDNIPEVDEWVTSLVYYEAEFMERIDRLRCFSTSLDMGGVRFALVLILIAGCLSTDRELRANTPQHLARARFSVWITLNSTCANVPGLRDRKSVV